jgi:hypothetical protein
MEVPRDLVARGTDLIGMRRRQNGRCDRIVLLTVIFLGNFQFGKA